MSYESCLSFSWLWFFSLARPNGRPTDSFCVGVGDVPIFFAWLGVEIRRWRPVRGVSGARTPSRMRAGRGFEPEADRKKADVNADATYGGDPGGTPKRRPTRYISEARRSGGPSTTGRRRRRSCKTSHDGKTGVEHGPEGGSDRTAGWRRVRWYGTTGGRRKGQRMSVRHSGVEVNSR